MLSKLSPTGEILWQTDTYGPGKVAVDSQGNIALADSEVVQKIGPDGSPRWGVELGSGVQDEIADIAFDPAGNLYVAGKKGSLEESVVHLVKYDAGGALTWSRTYAPLARTSVEDLVVDPNGDVIIAGASVSSYPGDAVLQYLRKYDGDGNVLWTDEALENGHVKLAVDQAGNVFLADLFENPNNLSKYTPDGVRLWSARPDDFDGAMFDLAVTATGDVIAIGTDLDDRGQWHTWAAQFDGVDGTRRRPVRFDAPDTGRAVAVDRNGDVLLGGGYYGSWLRKYDGAVFARPW